MDYPERNLTFPADASVPLSVAEWTPGELAAVVTGCVLFGLTAAQFAVINLNRSVKYVKILSVSFLNAILVDSALLWFSALCTLRIIPQTGVFLACWFWPGWLWFGTTTGLISLLLWRLWRLDLIVCQKRDASGWIAIAPPLVLWGLFIPYAAASTALGLGGPWTLINFPTGPRVLCSLSDASSYALATHNALLVFVYVVLAVRLWRSRTRFFNEFSRSLLCFVGYLTCIIFISVMSLINATFTASGRIAIALVLGCCINIYLTVLVCSTVYNLLFRHEEALVEFKLLLANKFIVADSSLEAGSSSALGDAGSGSTAQRGWFARTFFARSPAGSHDGSSQHLRVIRSNSSIVAPGAASPTSHPGRDVVTVTLDADSILAELSTAGHADLDREM